jgi:FixJ family two-component response regulator
MHPHAPGRTLDRANRETNPPHTGAADAASSARELTLRQHAAIRHLVRGYPLGKIAAHLGVSRHTVTRWKHDPGFVAELERLRREMTAAIVSPSARATPPPRPMQSPPARADARGGPG